MFDPVGHIKGESCGSGTNNRETGRSSGPLSQTISGCPSILTGLSREMRTQMNAIVAFSYLLKNKEYSDEEKEEFSNQIFSSCEQIISLFDNFLDSAIIDTGNSRSESRVCNPDEMFGNIFSDFREMVRREKYKDVILIYDSQTYQNSDYLIDINRVTRVIRNLLHNALYNTKSGYIKSGYFIRNEILTCFILDSGQGYVKCREFLQSQDMSQSLSKFNDTFTAVSMTLTRKLVRMLGGSVWIERNGLAGSGIYLSVPVTCATDTDTENEINKLSNTLSTI